MSSIADVAKQFLQQARLVGNNNIISLCPFHSEQSPSFCMSAQNGLWLCYACGAKGNLKQFLLRVGISETLLPIRYASALEEARKNKKAEPNPIRPKVLAEEPLTEDLLGLFNKYPTSLLNAGFLPETLNFFEVGFDNQHFRITYPLRDLKGNLLGISGRQLDGADGPKYKVYTKEYKTWGLPERPEVSKSSILWNAHNLYSYVHFGKNPPFVVVVEGYKACMWVWQAGIKDVVALQGNRMSYEQKWILQKIGAPVHLMLDNNSPGWSGMAAVGKELLGSLTVRIVDYDTEQPDQLTEDQVQTSAACAKDYMQIMLEVS